MPVITIRILPEEPVSAVAFAEALEGLTITVFEISFANLEGTAIGQASFLPLPDVNAPDEPDEDTGIVQHWSDLLPGPGEFLQRRSVATAVIDVPEGQEEHGTSDLRLEITRSGGTIIHEALHYNVRHVAGDASNPADFPFLPGGAGQQNPILPGFAAPEVSLYVFIPAAGREILEEDAFVPLPEDGSPPAFGPLFAAVDRVLSAEPSSAPAIDALEQPESEHVAREMAANPRLFPLPEPDLPLDRLYTGPHDSDNDTEAPAQREFEAALTRHRAEFDTRARRLAGYVRALSAAVAAAERSAVAERIAIPVPLGLLPQDTRAKRRSVVIVLEPAGGAVLPLDTRVLTEAWYALGAIFPVQVSLEQRYDMAIRMGETELLEALDQALVAGAISAEGSSPPLIGGAMSRERIVRRLLALGAPEGLPVACPLEGPGTPAAVVAQAYLDFEGEDVAGFWDGIVTSDPEGHLDLILCAITGGHGPLEAAIRNHLQAPGVAPPGIDSVATLATVRRAEWRALFFDGLDGSPIVARLPPFTLPGTPAERVEAFLVHLNDFFAVPFDPAALDSNPAEAPPLLERPLDDPIQRFIGHFDALAGVGDEFAFGTDHAEATMEAALEASFPEDPQAQAWLAQAIARLDALHVLTEGVTPTTPLPDGFLERWRDSLKEALYNAGFERLEDVSALDVGTFQTALAGTIAFDVAAQIHAAAGAPQSPGPAAADEGFRPVNADDCVVNCIPLPHRSPLGPIGYLQELLRLTPRSSCEMPFPPVDILIEDGVVVEGDSVAALLVNRCGNPAELAASRANLEIQLPLIHLANECLEHLAAEAPGPFTPDVHDTASETLAGHRLCQLGETPEPTEEPCHDQTTLFHALPEHSSPAVPVATPTAYERLAEDFSHCCLPYSQPHDVNRSYLEHFFGQSRFSAMRRFWAETSEFVRDPENPPGGLRPERWREPVAEPIAAEYLYLAPAELEQLFHDDIPLAELHAFYGFPSADVDGQDWFEVVVRLDVLLTRTCLSYCEFLELWRSRFVGFHRAAGPNEDTDFPECEPCLTRAFHIEFTDPQDPEDALRRLAVFIRLWRILQGHPGARYGFDHLADICNDLGLFHGDGTINPGFFRELYAFQRLRDLLGLPLQDPEDIPPPLTNGPTRTQLLHFTNPGGSKFAWALDAALDALNVYAPAEHDCPPCPPHHLKLIADNLDALSDLAGFDRSSPGDRYFDRWAHLLRFFEFLGKLYASPFSPVEVLFLFTADPQRAGHEPLPLQPDNEARWRPFDSVDYWPEMSLFALRGKLLAAEVEEEAVAALTWSEIGRILRSEFGYAVPAAGTDFLERFGDTFLPSFKEASGTSVAATARRFETALADTVPTMDPLWNTPVEDRPFGYDSAAGLLFVELPLQDEAVLRKLASMRPLSNQEAAAVRTVYFAPREVLCALGFLFPDKGEADRALVQEPDQEKRIAYFKRAVAFFRARCRIIAEHLAQHVDRASEYETENGPELAHQMLVHLRADDNFQGSWDTEAGGVPAAFWSLLPLGGAFHALLGLLGTGLLGEYRRANGILAWRDVQGPLALLSDERNAHNAPQPTVVPSLNIGTDELTEAQDHFLGVRNGSVFDPATGEVLGGIEGFTLELSGFLLVDEAGSYDFSLEVDEEAECFLAWHLKIRQGDYVNTLLVKDWPSESGPERAARPVRLRRGIWRLEIAIRRKALEPDGPEDLCPQRFGVTLRYSGADTAGESVVVPRERLFLDRRERFVIDTSEIDLPTAPQLAVLDCYVPRIQDMQRTYIRAFKAQTILAKQGISPLPVTDTLRSELEVFLDDPEAFGAESHFRDGPSFGTYHLPFVLDTLPLTANHTPNAEVAAIDGRADPTLRHVQAVTQLYFEDLFDYGMVRAATARARKAPVVNFFQEVHEEHSDEAMHGLVSALFHEDHAPMILTYFDGVTLTAAELFGFVWLIRLWRAETWLRVVRRRFRFADPRGLRPDLIAANDPLQDVVVGPGETDNGNANLTRAVREGLIEAGEPRRYHDLRQVNEQLSLRANRALIAFLTRRERLPLSWGGFAESGGEIAEFLLYDAEPELCRKVSRIQLAISRIQTLVRRARAGGLEPGFEVTPAFLELWDKRFATFEIWLQCKRRELYPEDWIHWEERRRALRIEAYAYLEEMLGSSVLTAAVQGALDYWPDRRPPAPPARPLQASEPMTMRLFEPDRDGFAIFGNPERRARPIRLAHLRAESGLPPGIDFDNVPGAPEFPTLPECALLPWWMRAAMDLGADFVRVDAAAVPLADRPFAPTPDDEERGCCVCCEEHEPCIDEWYFWLVPGTAFEPQDQDPELGVTPDDPTSDWQRPNLLPSLLRWPPERTLYLVWCRRHNGSFLPPCRSTEALRVEDESLSERLSFLGRQGDSLTFAVAGALRPEGHDEDQPVGFRYDMASERATALPEVVAASVPTPLGPGELQFYPYFVYCPPGAPLFPLGMFVPALTIAGHLRSHCRFEPALRWLRCVLAPLESDMSELWCHEGEEPAFEADELARRRALVLAYVSTLLAWLDALWRQNSPEAFAQARAVAGTTGKILGPRPRDVLGPDYTGEPPTVQAWTPDEPPLNPRLVALYETLEDRLAQIRSCMTAHRLGFGRPTLDMPYFGELDPAVDWPEITRRCSPPSRDGPCPDDADWCCPPSPYRFEFLVRRALELVGDVRAFGAELRTALEKGDAEYLAALRERQGEQIARLARDARQMDWRARDLARQALQESRRRILTDLSEVDLLIENGLSQGERSYQVLTGVSLGFLVASRVLELIAQFMHLMPDQITGTVGPLPIQAQVLPMGDKIASSLSTAARITDGVSAATSMTAGLENQNAVWARRADRWEHERALLLHDLDVVDRQILEAERSRDAALIELNRQELALAHARELSAFLRQKLTGHAFYLWQVETLSGLYHQLYDLALHAARQAEHAFHYQRGDARQRFLPSGHWQTLDEGLLAGEGLQLALKQMEKAYEDLNQRHYELRQSFSLRRDFPLAFLALKETGSCEVELTEWRYDQQRPGAYMRQISLVTLDVPCVVGPHTNVNARLTLLSHQLRLVPHLLDPPAACCPPEESNGYDAFPHDPRILARPGGLEAMATSSGSSDGGMHELTFSPADGRYVYFQWAGAVARFLLELRQANNRWDLASLSDVILSMNYTAREGGESLRKAAEQSAEAHLPGDGLRLFEVARELPDAWSRLQASLGEADAPTELSPALRGSMFPYVPGRPKTVVQRLILFFAAAGAEPGAYRIVTYRPPAPEVEPPGQCKTVSVYCVATAEWPGLFWGVLELPERMVVLRAERETRVGTFVFPPEIDAVERTYLVCDYEKISSEQQW